MHGRNSLRPKLVLLLVSSLSWLGFAQQQTNAVPVAPAQTPVTERAQGLPLPPSAIRLGVGDLIEVRVFGVPDLTQTVRIDSRGEVSLPLIGSISVAGHTAEQAERLIAEHLKSGGFLVNPQVSVFVKESSNQAISVMGEVEKPGVYPLLGVRRLYDAIAAAGGLTSRAGKLITVAHRNQQAPVVIEFSADPSKSLENNVEIFPGDTVIVSKAGLVYVVGDVVQAGGFIMENNENISVLQAVALARGPNRTAALGHSKIIRRIRNGYEEIPIRLDRMLAAKAPDIALHPNDIVFVPNSAAKSAAKRGLESIVQVATGLAIYRR